MFNDLKNFQAIAWDFDETLIESTSSYFIEQFILENPQIRHCIITFRAHGYEKDVWKDLRLTRSELKKSNFVHLYNIPDELFDAGVAKHLLRIAGDISGPLTEAEIMYKEWKGKTCAEHGYPVLVDDRTEDCRLGCEKYGVKLVHPHDCF